MLLLLVLILSEVLVLVFVVIGGVINLDQNKFRLDLNHIVFVLDKFRIDHHMARVYYNNNNNIGGVMTSLG